MFEVQQSLRILIDVDAIFLGFIVGGVTMWGFGFWQGIERSWRKLR